MVDCIHICFGQGSKHGAGDDGIAQLFGLSLVEDELL